MTEKFFDAIRKKNVEALPEEIVRQSLLKIMVEKLRYPKDLIAVEKDLGQLPHLKDVVVPLKRRADIICFANNIHPVYELYPLLMIECKAGKLIKEHVDQVVGYNYFVKSYFIAIASAEEIKTLWYNKKKGGYEVVNFLPAHEELMRVVLNGKSQTV